MAKQEKTPQAMKEGDQEGFSQETRDLAASDLTLQEIFYKRSKEAEVAKAKEPKNKAELDSRVEKLKKDAGLLESQEFIETNPEDRENDEDIKDATSFKELRDILDQKMLLIGTGNKVYSAEELKKNIDFLLKSRNNDFSLITRSEGLRDKVIELYATDFEDPIRKPEKDLQLEGDKAEKAVKKEESELKEKTKEIEDGGKQADFVEVGKEASTEEVRLDQLQKLRKELDLLSSRVEVDKQHRDREKMLGYFTRPFKLLFGVIGLPLFSSRVSGDQHLKEQFEMIKDAITGNPYSMQVMDHKIRVAEDKRKSLEDQIEKLEEN